MGSGEWGEAGDGEGVWVGERMKEIRRREGWSGDDCDVWSSCGAWGRRGGVWRAAGRRESCLKSRG